MVVVVVVVVSIFRLIIDDTQIWCRGSRPYGAHHSDVEAKIGSWGTGDSIVTRLLSPTGEVCGGSF